MREPKQRSLDQLREILIEIQAEALHEGRRAGPAEGPPPFITISRQTGVNASELAAQLAHRLTELDPEKRAWATWDKELVERVAADHQLSKELVDALGQPGHSWLSEFMSTLLPFGEPIEEAGIYHRVVKTIAMLATAGRAIIVGRGGAFITRRLPGGLHVRLVAPLEARIEAMEHRLQVSHEHAARYVHAADAARRAFYHRYWPKESLDPDSFTITLNAAELSIEKMVDALVPLVGATKAPAAVSASTKEVARQ